jgi:hypothetical protein
MGNVRICTLANTGHLQPLVEGLKQQEFVEDERDQIDI